MTDVCLAFTSMRHLSLQWSVVSPVRMAVCSALVACCGCGGTTDTVFQIASSSMAPALTGPTRLAVCEQCTQAIDVATDTYVAELPTRCWSCGGVCRVSDIVQPGEMVTVHAWKDTEQPTRFALVAFNAEAKPGRTARQESTPQVKRVWALPGETVEIEGGEMFVDGQLLQKSLLEFQQMAVPVAHYPNDRRSHWYLESEGQSLQLEQREKSETPVVELAPDQSLYWQFHRPARVHPREVSPLQWLEASQIVDDYRENQGSRHELHPVADYSLEILLQRPLSGTLFMTCRYRGQSVLVEVLPEGPPQPRTSEFQSPEAGLSVRCILRMLICFCDERVFIASDADSQLVRWDEVSAVPASTQQPLVQLACTQSTAIQQLVIHRDLYIPDSVVSELDRTGYFLLGDNLPVSVDSRNGLGRIPRERMLGRVTKTQP